MKAAEGMLFLLLARSVASSSNESGEFAARAVHIYVYTTFCRMTVNARNPITISGKCGIHRLNGADEVPDWRILCMRNKSHNSQLLSNFWPKIIIQVLCRKLMLVRSKNVPPNTHKSDVQPPRSTRSSSLVALSSPPTISSLKITDRWFSREPVLNHTDPVRAVNPRHWLRCTADASPFAVMAGREALCCDHLNLAYSQVWACICKWKSCINWTDSEFDRRYFLLIISDIFDIFDIFENIKISNKSYNNVICYMLMHYLMNVSYQLFVPLVMG